MTLLPHDNRDVKGIPEDELPKYKVGPICAHPTCSRLSDHAHHLWRRSAIAGPFDWVRLWDGTIVQNLSPLCWRHHEQITGNKDKILLLPQENADTYTFAYYEQGLLMGMLTPEPKIFPKSMSPPDMSSGLHDVVPEKHVHSEHGLCPTCHQRVKPKIENKPEQKRPRATWTVTVPADQREMGADVLDTLLESARIEMDTAGISYGSEGSNRYYILSTALALFVQHAEDLFNNG